MNNNQIPIDGVSYINSHITTLQDLNVSQTVLKEFLRPSSFEKFGAK